MDCSLPGPSVHGILQAGRLEWVVVLFSRGSSPPRDGTQVFCIAGRFFIVWTTREAPYVCVCAYIYIYILLSIRICDRILNIVPCVAQ